MIPPEDDQHNTDRNIEFHPIDSSHQNQQLLQFLRDCLHGATRKPYSYCTSTMQSYKSYCFSEPTIITTHKRLLTLVLPANLTPIVLPPCKASNPT